MGSQETMLLFQYQTVSCIATTVTKMVGSLSSLWFPLSIERTYWVSATENVGKDTQETTKQRNVSSLRFTDGGVADVENHVRPFDV